MYTAAPSAEELAAFGLTLDDLGDDDVQVWPDNWQAYRLFGRMQTQWRTGGMGGATGLDYNVLFRMMDRMGLAPEEYDALESDILLMELTALEVMAERRES